VPALPNENIYTITKHPPNRNSRKGETMKVSIVTPTLNSEKYLRETILSIKNQRLAFNIEHIVVDGGSTDKTKAIVESEAISKFYTLEGSSMYEAIDFGFHKSSGDILCWLNSDDLFAHDTIKIVTKYFANNTNAKIIAGNTIYLDAAANDMYAYRYPQIPLSLLKCFNTLYLCQPSIFWNREVYFELGGLNLSYKIIADRDFVLRAADKYGIQYVNHILSKFRLHSESLSNTKTEAVNIETTLMNKDLGIGSTTFFKRIFSIAGHLYIKLYNYEMVLWKLFSLSRYRSNKRRTEL